MARFTKQGKLVRERKSKTAPMGVEMSAGDLLTTWKLKNTDATTHLHIDQRNIPSAVQVSVVKNTFTFSHFADAFIQSDLQLGST